MDQPVGIANPGAPTRAGNLDGHGEHADLGVAQLDRVDRRQRRLGLHALRRTARAVGTTAATIVHGHGPRLLDELHARGRGVRRLRQHVAASAPDASTPPAPPRRAGRGVRVRRRVGRDGRATRPGTAHTARSPARPGRPAATAAGSRFNGINDHVALGGPRHLLQQRASRSKPGCRRARRRTTSAIVGTWAGSGPMLWVDHIAGHHYLTLGGSLSSYLDSGQSPIAGQWQHLAATYDGTTARYYIDGDRGRHARRLGQRRQLEHVADRRLRRQPRRLLRRAHRQRPHLQPRAHAPARSSSTGTTAVTGSARLRTRRPERSPARSTATAAWARRRSAGAPRPTTSA